MPREKNVMKEVPGTGSGPYFGTINIKHCIQLDDGEWKSRTNRELEEMSKGENIVKWIKGQRISWFGHLERMSRTGRDKKKGKTQERMERGSRKRCSSAGSEKMEGVGGR